MSLSQNGRQLCYLGTQPGNYNIVRRSVLVRDQRHLVCQNLTMGTKYMAHLARLKLRQQLLVYQLSRLRDLQNMGQSYVTLGPGGNRTRDNKHATDHATLSQCFQFVSRGPYLYPRALHISTNNCCLPRLPRTFAKELVVIVGRSEVDGNDSSSTPIGCCHSEQIVIRPCGQRLNE